MARPKQNEEKIQQILNAWRDLAPNKSFGGMTLDQFKVKVQPSFDARSKPTESKVRRTVIE